jgi:hypothetical protein
MFCSECGGQNVSGAKYCRACGAALGQPSEPRRVVLVRRPEGGKAQASGVRRRVRGGKRPDAADGVRDLVVGGGLLTTALVLALSLPAPALMAWFFLFLFVLVIPGLYLLGGGAARVARAWGARAQGTTPAAPSQLPPAAGRAALGERTTAELVPPPSVTEETTARLTRKPPRGWRGEADE